MAIVKTLPLAAAFFASSVAGQIFLSPDQDIVFPASDSASNPLIWLGGNGPYSAGPDVNGVKNEVPGGCVVEQVAYVARHGSRYPDTGAYNEWVALFDKVGLLTICREGILS